MLQITLDEGRMHNRAEDNGTTIEPDIKPSSTTSLLRNFISGSLAGAIVATPTSIVETTKKMLQRNEQITKASFPKLFYGIPVFIAHVAPATAIQLATDAALKKYLPTSDSFATNILRSFYCGVQGAIVATFVEATIVTQQVYKIKTFDAVKHMFNKSPLEPWRTMPLISSRDGTYAMFLLTINPIIAKYGRENYGRKGEFVGVSLSSVVGAAVSHPFDTLATYIQDQRAKGNDLSIVKGIHQKIANEGVKSLFRGYLPRLGLFFTFSNAIPVLQNAVNEKLDTVEKKFKAS